MKGLLITMTEAPARHEEEFNAWYDTEHIADRLAIRGFLSASRWESAASVGSGKYLATYELDSPQVLESDAYRKVSGEHFTPWSKRCLKLANVLRRWGCAQLAPGNAPPPEESGAVYFECADVEQAGEGELNRCYDEDHVPRLRSVPGVLAVRRFLAPAGKPRYVALCHLADEAVVESTQWRAACEAPAARRIRELAGAGEWIGRCYRAYPGAP